MLIGTGVMAVTLQGLCGAQGTVHTSEGCPKGPVTLLSVGPRDGSFTPHLTSRVRTRTTVRLLSVNICASTWLPSCEGKAASEVSEDATNHCGACQSTTPADAFPLGRQMFGFPTAQISSQSADAVNRCQRKGTSGYDRKLRRCHKPLQVL